MSNEQKEPTGGETSSSSSNNNKNMAQAPNNATTSNNNNNNNNNTTSPRNKQQQNGGASGSGGGKNVVNDTILPDCPVEQWPDKPIMCCVHNKCQSYITTRQPRLKESEQLSPHIRVNEVFEFESRSFKGKCIIRVPNMPNSQNWYFANRRRKMDITVQGEFKRRIRYDKVLTGQAFDNPFRSFPGQMVISAGIALIKKLSPALRTDIDSNHPHTVSTLAQASQVINISEKGKETPLPDEPTEDLSLLHEKFRDMPPEHRKVVMSDNKELEKHYFEPGVIYSFSFYSHMISPSQYKFYILGWKFGIETYLPSPFQMMALVEDDDPYVNQLADAAAAEAEAAAESEAAKAKAQGNEGPSTLGNMPDNDGANGNNGNGNVTTSSSPERERVVRSHPLDHVDYLWNFEVWHEKLVDELTGANVPPENDAANDSSISSYFKSLW